MTTRRATVVWELSEEGTVVVDVDAPVRPFGEQHSTPPRGTRIVPLEQTPPEPKVEGRGRTLPPLPAQR